jgi:hypothetical protein
MILAVSECRDLLEQVFVVFVSVKFGAIQNTSASSRSTGIGVCCLATLKFFDQIIDFLLSRTLELYKLSINFTKDILVRIIKFLKKFIPLNFTIRVNQLEQSNTRADFDMLAQMAKQTGGLCFKDTQLNELADSLLANANYKKLAYAQTTSDELIDFPWILAFLLALAGLEWFSRKRLGFY